MRLKMVTVAMVCGVVAATATAALAEGKDQGERFVVTGVMVLANGKGLAWLQEPKFTGDRPVLVRAGERIGPYQVTAVLEDRVELEGPNGRVLVPLRNANGAPAVGSATPNASAAGPAVVPPTKHVPRGRELHRLEMEARRLQRREQSGPAQEGQSQSPQSEKKQSRQTEGQPAQVQPAQNQPAQNQPAQSQESRAAFRPGGPAATNPSGGSSKVIFLLPGDPLRKQTFQSMIGVGK